MPEVTDRVATGAVNGVRCRTSRPRQILWANLLTRSKAIIAVLCARVLIFGQLIDAVSGLLIEVKSVVGVVQDREKSGTHRSP
ncbi:hypothetical protein OG470_05860 [Micromonospora sp. NBC_00389]|uniref:hypothetical protein n=1 Tax=Micromonospora sp. NBC_00389 TaxID=2903586 RepID=UPI002E2043F9